MPSNFMVLIVFDDVYTQIGAWLVQKWRRLLPGNVTDSFRPQKRM